MTSARLDKIRRLAESSTYAGERAAATAALERIGEEAAQPSEPADVGVEPPRGTPAWFEGVNTHQRMLLELQARLGDPTLTAAEIRTLRNWIRCKGSPWEPGADELRRLHSRLVSPATAPRC